MQIEKIMDMLDWNMSAEIQNQGRTLAKSIDTIQLFIQPLTPNHNKNVWDNCAIIIASRSDEELKPYLVELLEWLQDLNWPGALCIWDRLKKYTDSNSIESAIKICLNMAKNNRDKTWHRNLADFVLEKDY